MSLRSSVKTEINEAARAIVGDSVAGDYTRDKASAERVVAALHDDVRYGGWIIEAWVDEESQAWKDPPLSDWTTGTRVILRRIYSVSVTRSPEHQALVESLGQVQVGDNTYSHPYNEHYAVDVWRKRSSNQPDTYENSREAVIGLCQSAAVDGPRPPGRVGDIT